MYRRWHGGPDKAVYALASEDAAWWSDDLGRELPPGIFGENLTTAGIDVSGALIGERWEVGSDSDGVLLEVTMPRTPCENLSARLGIPRFHQRFAATGNTGTLLKVLRPGSVRAGDHLKVAHRPDHPVTVRDLSAGVSAASLLRMLGSDVTLAGSVRAKASRVIRRAEARG
jgi:MOSC domain-containing protein YiiM